MTTGAAGVLVAIAPPDRLSIPATDAAPAEVPPPKRKLPQKGPDLARWYFETWHDPYPGILDPAENQRIWREIDALPSESDFGGAAVNAWECIGPFGMENADGGQWTGRVLDIEAERSASIRVAAASGGLWEFFLFFPLPMTEDVKSQWAATFSTHPNDEDTIVLGTGEPGVSSGMGLWKKTSGSGWARKPLTPEPAGFYRVRHAPNGTTVHAATTHGYYRSTDGGETWTRTLSGSTTDLAIHPTTPSVLYTTVWGSGLYKSNNAGSTWSKITSGGIPTSGVARGAVDLGLDRNGGTHLYVAFANEDHFLHGIYSSRDGGLSWTDVSPPVDYLWGQGWYNNVLAVCPTDEFLVLAGGGGLWRTTNGGSSWVEHTSYPHLHVDYHAIRWHSDGEQVWVGHDGGVSYSADAGQTWDSASNIMPVTQYVNVHAGVSDVNLIGGGSQDNGMSITEDGGGSWFYRSGGDGGGFAVDTGDANRVYSVFGHWGDPLAFRRYRSTNKGATWQDVNTGIDPSQMWYPRIRTNQTSPPTLFTNSDNWVYISTNQGSLWTKLNPTAFPSRVHEITATRYEYPSAVVYACCSPVNLPGQRLFVYDGGVWYERTGANFPATVTVRKVAPHPSDVGEAFAIMNGLGTPGQKIYKTTNRGATWWNKTGNLPDQPMSDVVGHPTNDLVMYAGSGFGCFRTTDGGGHWHRWNNGMPEATIVTEMGYLDTRSQNGQFWVIAGTYGRGIWKREISGDDPAAVAEALPRSAGLRQNRPNPFDRVTTIEFTLPAAEPVALRVFDVAGREVAELVDEERTAGVHRFDFDASRLAAGTYFYKLTTAAGDQVKKMIVER
jgi:photosystem II stability/assembly factor-like uncharacterized protein